MTVDDPIQRAAAARTNFYEKLAISAAAGQALRQSKGDRRAEGGLEPPGDPMVAQATMRALDALADAEERAVEAHRQAYARPTRQEMLEGACKEANFPRPHPVADPDAWEFWVDSVCQRMVFAPEEHHRARELLEHAVRYAKVGRLFSATEMLRLVLLARA